MFFLVATARRAPSNDAMSVTENDSAPSWRGGSKPNRWRQEGRAFFDMSIAILMVIATVLLIWMAIRNLTTPATSVREVRAEAALPSELLSLAGAAMMGAEDAPVVLIIYSDFQCPFCGQFARDVLPEITDAYVATGRLRLVFRHLPLESIHPMAVGAAAAAECAGRQGQFWPMHDLLFKVPSRLSPEQYRSNAADLRLLSEAFDTCLAGTEATAKVRADSLASQSLGLSSTPTLHIGLITPGGTVKVVEQFSGVPQVGALRKRLDTVLAAATPSPR